MSLNRENVIWQSEDGTWNRGFFEHHTTNSDRDDFDEEWDVEYDYDNFNWVSAGHRSEDDAHQSWDGANPGGYNGANQVAAARYDDMAAKLCRQQKGHRYGRYFGPPKRRTIEAIREDLDAEIDEQRWHQMDGYANDHTAAIKDLEEQFAEANTRPVSDESIDRMKDLAKERTARLTKVHHARQERLNGRPGRYPAYNPEQARSNARTRTMLNELEAEIESRVLQEQRWETKPAATGQAVQGRKGDGTFDVVPHSEPDSLRS